MHKPNVLLRSELYLLPQPTPLTACFFLFLHPLTQPQLPPPFPVEGTQQSPREGSHQQEFGFVYSWSNRLLHGCSTHASSPGLELVKPWAKPNPASRLPILFISLFLKPVCSDPSRPLSLFACIFKTRTKNRICLSPGT